MDRLKKLLLFFLLSCFIPLSFGTPPSKIVFFGDSLSDPGNVWRLSLHIVPKSPPYYQGRFSNGQTWAEYVSKYYYDKDYIPNLNFAMGGATAVFHRPTLKFVSLFTLAMQIDTYLVESLFTKRNEVLYVIWIGHNDYMFSTDPDMDHLSTRVVDRISWAINRLIQWGGRNFLILNLADISETPYAKDDPLRPRYQILTTLHNKKLAESIDQLKEDHPDYKFVLLDVNAPMLEAMNDIDKYNKKYHVHVTNVNEACWRGGFIFNYASQQSLTEEIRHAMEKQTRKVGLTDGSNASSSKEVDPELMSNFILHNPSTSVAYTTGQMYAHGMLPCSNPDEYLFWDKLHPTQVAHEVLAQIAINRLAYENLG